MRSMRHDNETGVFVLYHCDEQLQDATKQGPIVNFNLLRPDGRVVGFAEVRI